MKLLGNPAWTAQGPSPIIMSRGSTTGAMQAVIGRRQGNANVFDLFVASVNGGIWRTVHFTPAMLQGGVTRAAGINWVPLTDNEPSLSVGCLALDPTDGTGNTLWAGTGHFSSAQQGGPAVGLLKSTNVRSANPNWQVLGNQAQQGNVSLVGQRIVSVVPTTLVDSGTRKQIVLAAAFDGEGIVKSADGGATFQHPQGPAGPLVGFATDLLVDPNDPNTFYAAFRASYDNQLNLVARGGIFRSQDGGQTWTSIHPGIPRADRSKSIKLGIFDNRGGSATHASSTVLYAAIADTSGNTNNLIGIFRTGNPRDPMPFWSAVFSDPDPHHVPNGLGAGQWPAAAAVPWFGLAVDPLNWHRLFIGGMSWLYKVVAQVSGDTLVGSQWAKWDDGAFYDHRCMTFLTESLLLGTGDQGVYALHDPGAHQPWMSLNNTIAVTEFFGVAYDPTTDFVCGGGQDIGTPVENPYGTWNQLADGGGDGAVVFVAGDGTYFFEVNGTFKRTVGAWSNETDRSIYHTL